MQGHGRSLSEHWALVLIHAAAAKPGRRCRPLVLAVKRLRQEDNGLQANLGYIARHCHKIQNIKPNKAKRSCSLWVCVKHTALGSSVLRSLSCCEATSISQMRLSLPKINEVIPAKRRKTGSCSPASWAVADNSFGTQFRAMLTSLTMVFLKMSIGVWFAFSVLSPCGVREQGKAPLPQNAGIRWTKEKVPRPRTSGYYRGQD